MDLRDFRHVSSASAPAFTVTLTLTVEDVRALWSAAAERALAAPGMTLGDALDTLGPREDPSVADCIAMLAAPARIAGCELDGFEVLERREVAPAPILLPPPTPALCAAHA